MRKKDRTEKLRDGLMLGDDGKPKGRDRLFYFLAFFLPMVVLELVYISFQVFPFGERSLLALDLNAQYIYYYEGFRDAVWGDGSLIYSWSRTLGGETFGLNAYYMGSPFMIFFVLFPKTLITEALLLTALLKTGCAGLSFAYFLKSSRGGDKRKILIFSTMYALMTYMVMHQMNPMWLDAVIALPLVMLGVDRLIKEGKFVLYTAALVYTFVANFYIGYMVAIFMVIYFFYSYFTNCTFGPGNGRNFIKKALLFALFSVLAAFISAFMLIPAYFSLTLGKMEFSNPSYALKEKFPLVDMLPKFLFGAYDTVRPSGLPTLYTGTLTLLMLPLFFLNRDISPRRKIAAGAVVLVLVLSMTMSTVDMFWHGLQNPNWLNYRYSFILCAMLLIMGYEAFSKPEGYGQGAAGGSMLALVAVIFLVDKYAYEYVDVRITIWPSLVLALVLFAFVAADSNKKGRGNKALLAGMIAVVCLELCANGIVTVYKVHMDIVFSSRTSYRPFVDQTYKAAQWLKEYDGGFYRSEKNYVRAVNDPLAFGLKGISHSSSTLNRDAIAYIKSLGYRTASHWTEYSGPVITRDSIIGIKYLLSKTEAYNGLELLHETDGIYIYENPHALPVVYPVDREYLTRVYGLEYETEDEYENSYGGEDGYTGENPFAEQNRLLSAMLGSSDVIAFYKPLAPEAVETEHENVATQGYGKGYTKYYPDLDGESAKLIFKIPNPDLQTIYAAFPSDYPRKVNLWVNDAWYGRYLENASDDGIIALWTPRGEDAGTEIKLTMDIISTESGGKGEVFLGAQLFYYFDHGLFEEQFGPVRDSVKNLTLKTATKMTMDINVGENQVLYTSIPYERGWNAKANGIAVSVFRTENGLVGLELPPGDYSLELWFLPDYFVFSVVISGAALLLFLMIALIDRMMRKRGIKLPGAAEIWERMNEDDDGDDGEEFLLPDAPEFRTAGEIPDQEMPESAETPESAESAESTESTESTEKGSGSTVEMIGLLISGGLAPGQDDGGLSADTIEIPVLRDIGKTDGGGMPKAEDAQPEPGETPEDSGETH